MVFNKNVKKSFHPMDCVNLHEYLYFDKNKKKTFGRFYNLHEIFTISLTQ